VDRDLTIKESIKTYFDFLCSDFGATLIKEEIDSFGVFLTYITEKAGLRISFEPREGGLFVMVFPLKDQKIPEYQDWYDVLDLFQVKGVKFVEQRISNCEDPDMKEVKQALKHFADNVRIHAQNFLQGDFSVIRALEQIVKQRAETI
jgi:hypothetical protein